MIQTPPSHPSVFSNGMLMPFLTCHWSARPHWDSRGAPTAPPPTCVHHRGAFPTVSRHWMDISFWERCEGGNVVIHCGGAISADQRNISNPNSPTPTPPSTPPPPPPHLSQPCLEQTMPTSSKWAASSFLFVCH